MARVAPGDRPADPALDTWFVQLDDRLPGEVPDAEGGEREPAAPQAFTGHASDQAVDTWFAELDSELADVDVRTADARAPVDSHAPGGATSKPVDHWIDEIDAVDDPAPQVSSRSHSTDPAGAIDRALVGLVAMAAGLTRLEEVVAKMDDRT